MPELITDYKILEDITPDGLSRQVREAIAKGWQPWGSLLHVQYSYEDDEHYYTQAMVRKEVS